MIRLLLDQGLPRSTVPILADQGIPAAHVGDLGMATATDQEIIEAAVARESVVVTLDCDFHALLAASGARRPSVVRIRIERLKGADLADILLKVIQEAESDLVVGAAISVTERGIRIRHLPLI